MWSVACHKSGVALRRDGENHNLTWNCGAEGDTAKQNVLRLRQRQMRNLAAALLLSHGVPMIHMGDEYGHSKVMFQRTLIPHEHLVGPLSVQHKIVHVRQCVPKLLS